MRLLSLTIVFAGAAVAASPAHATELVGFASLDANTFASGPPSGNGISGNGLSGPFPGQPVQGFSAILNSADGTPNRFLSLADNGYGAKANSADFLLRAYDVSVDFRTVSGGTGAVTVNGFLQMADPNAVLTQALTRPDRILTGADFDPESIRRLPDGTYYIGEEFGPALVHVDANFNVIEDRIALPGVVSPDSPAGGTPNLPGSGGFEGMAISPDGKTLYPMLEKAVVGDAANSRRINVFDVPSASFTGDYFTYLVDADGNSIGDFTWLDANRFVVIERDNGQGATALFKKLFLVDLTKVDANGNLIKTQLADLLDIQDPNDLNGDGSTKFTFPFQTIESVLPVDAQTLLVTNDNNYPFSNGRTPGQADNNEFILIRLDSAVPEPATWAMMIAGFGLVGGALRRRRAGVAIA